MADNPAGTLQGDYSSMYNSDFDSIGSSSDQLAAGFSSQPLFNAIMGDYAKDSLDAKRSEQSAQNAFVRDLLKLQEQNIFNAAESAKTRDFNALEAQKNRDWQERMSNTAYQRAVNDMKLSGLNPALLYSQGQLASFGSGSSASSGSASSGSGSGSSGVSHRSSASQGAQVAAMLIKVVAGLLAG